MSTLEKAIALAATQHAGQLDKGGQPYILHPLTPHVAIFQSYPTNHCGVA